MELTPSKVGSNVYSVLGNGSEQSFAVSPEILDPVGIICGLVNWHLRLIHYREPVFRHATYFVSTTLESF